jgi:hypothetical protein
MNDRRSPLLERPVMRDQFRKELRGRLMSEAVVALAPQRGRFSFPTILRPAFAAAALLVLVLAGATSAAASSLPGDPLYAVKRASEDVRLALSVDGSARLQLLSELADRRLTELAEVAQERPSAAPAATQQYAEALDKVARALDDARVLTDSTNDEQKGQVEEAQGRRLKTLDAIKETIPVNARAGVDRLLQREKDRRTQAPSGPSTTEVQNTERPSPEGGNGKKATPRAATPNPEQRATPRPNPTDGGDDQHRD